MNPFGKKLDPTLERKKRTWRPKIRKITRRISDTVFNYFGEDRKTKIQSTLLTNPCVNFVPSKIYRPLQLRTRPVLCVDTTASTSRGTLWFYSTLLCTHLSQMYRIHDDEKGS
eukprot:TRINITY_DN7884_c0_g1_i1.p1 TRINITY_DN7884_c0_g1~~TRINITY_DN7884_c0_g1_i1.p1  ORF type:complete len:113 (+),score=8.25 TRINITY_DN7884_c0_g1_i1:607-945(+)